MTNMMSSKKLCKFNIVFIFVCNSLLCFKHKHICYFLATFRSQWKQYLSIFPHFTSACLTCCSKCINEFPCSTGILANVLSILASILNVGYRIKDICRYCVIKKLNFLWEVLLWLTYIENYISQYYNKTFFIIRKWYSHIFKKFIA